MDQLEYSRKQVSKAGETILRALSSQDGTVSDIEINRAFIILNYWRSCHNYPINTFQATLRNKLKKIDKRAIVAQRLKRLPSIVFKLNRIRGMKLARMQDIGGLRAVMSNLKKAYELKNNYEKTTFSHNLHKVVDYIHYPKESGYRGIHLVYKYKNTNNPLYDGLFVELQIRTKLQHVWATAVETVGTYLDYSLKSSEGPTMWLEFFALVSSAFAHQEGTKPVPNYSHMTPLETFQKVVKKMDEIGVHHKLAAFSVATKHISLGSGLGSYHLIILDLEKKNVRVKTYSKSELEVANQEYTEYEREAQKVGTVQVVLVSTGSVRNLKTAYPNYFLDTREFLKRLSIIRLLASDTDNNSLE